MPLVANFEITLTNLLDRHAPIKKRTITLRPYAPWYNDSIDVEKKKRRKLERRWRMSSLSTDRQLYITQCGIVNDMIRDAKSVYCSSIIAENKGNLKVPLISYFKGNKSLVSLHQHRVNDLLMNLLPFFMKRYLRCGAVCLMIQNL